MAARPPFLAASAVEVVEAGRPEEPAPLVAIFRFGDAAENLSVRTHNKAIAHGPCARDDAYVIDAVRLRAAEVAEQVRPDARGRAEHRAAVGDEGRDGALAGRNGLGDAAAHLQWPRKHPPFPNVVAAAADGDVPDRIGPLALA